MMLPLLLCPAETKRDGINRRPGSAGACLAEALAKEGLAGLLELTSDLPAGRRWPLGWVTSPEVMIFIPCAIVDHARI